MSLSLSENNILPEDPAEGMPDISGESPDAGETGGDHDEENKEETGGGQTSGGEDEEGGGSGVPENPPVSAGGETGGSGGEAPSPAEGEESPDFMQEVLDSLGTLNETLGDTPQYDALVDSVRSLVDVMGKQSELLQSYALPSIPLSGYQDYSYPVHVIYRIYPVSLGSETKVSNDYASPEEFEDGYAYMSDSVASGSLAWFSIWNVTDAEGSTVYDEYAAPEEPENPEEPEEPDTFRDDVLAALGALNDNLNTVSANDLEYRGQSLELQEQYLKLQQENVELHYHSVVSNILIGFVLVLTLGYTIAHGFFQRMKVG